MNPSVYVGIDLGTSGMKAIAVDDSGGVLARDSARYHTQRPVPGASEQSPDDWVDAFASLVREIGAAFPAATWRAIGLTGMIPTLVTLDGDGRAVGPAITWEDNRAEGFGEELRASVGAMPCYEKTGQWLDGRHLLPMFLRLVAEEPQRAEATKALCSARDYLYYVLTGDLATDPSTAVGFGCFNLETDAFDADIVAAAEALAGSPLPALPAVRPTHSWQTLRRDLGADLGLEDTTICLGGADSVVGALGLGVTRPGDIAYLAGTSNVILGATNGTPRDPHHRFLVTPTAVPGTVGMEMDLLATGSSLLWLSQLVGTSERVDELLGTGETDNLLDAPLFLPYLAPGEQGALWDSELRGSILGLELRHDRRDLARGLLSGIVLESRRCVEVLAEYGGASGTINIAGGVASSDSFRRDLADATGRVVRATGDGETDCSARGAAQLAARAIDKVELPSAPLSAKEYAPERDRGVVWEALFAKYESAREAVTAHYHSRDRSAEDGSVGR